MTNSVVRLVDIQIQNFKNVKNGHLNLINRRKQFRASVLGLYGQNGSGKTALIDALQMLKHILSGQSVPDKFADYINVDEKMARLSFHFEMKDQQTGKCDIFYAFSMMSIENDTEQNTAQVFEQKSKKKVQIMDELLSFSYEDTEGNRKIRKGPFIDTSSVSVFVPNSKYELLFGKDRDVKQRLIVAKALASATSRSFIFSREFMTEMRKQQASVKQDGAEMSDERTFHSEIIERMVFYGNYELFVIGTSNTGIISLNALPLAFNVRHGEHGAVGNLMVPLGKTADIPDEVFRTVFEVVEDMNIVLKQIVPGLTISVMDLGPTVMKNGSSGRRIMLMSDKNHKSIPLQYESEGIKKIISVLQLLIVMYNKPSITIVIDELDSGIFEYLLGELLRILSEKGKGQLIFTSHNLRPLETLDRGFIAFTTTNPENRYIRLTNIKENNNLRDFYFRDIVLGEQREEVYNATNNAEIALAFREAGEAIGT